MGIERDTFLGFIDDLAVRPGRPRVERRGARGAAAPVPVALRPADQRHGGRAARRRSGGGSCSSGPRSGSRRAMTACCSSRSRPATRPTRRSPGRSRGRTAWRRRPGERQPGQIQLASPNDVHFHPPGGLRLPGQQRGDDDEPDRSNGRAPPVAGRRDGRAGREGRRRDARQADRAVGRAARRRADDAASCCRGSSARWTCGRT